ncbi:hypothetical protein [Specibacter sp. NPDC078709]|uniref:hypothetical protein n=1 Tax=Specibacter sp. NPDC078709 TaxID=3154364 RepID=UPI0034461B22
MPTGRSPIAGLPDAADLASGQEEFLGLDGTATDILEVENFTPIAPDGSLEVQLVVPESFQGSSLVAAVSLYELSDTVHPIAGHRDLDDPGQALTAYPTPGVRGSLANIAWLPSTGGTITERGHAGPIHSPSSA